MALAARDLKNDDTTDAGFDVILDGITSPVTGDVGVTRIDVGTGTTIVRMDSSNPLFAQLTAGTAEIGKLAAGTAEIGKLAAGVAEIGNVKNSGTFVVQSTLQAGTAAFGKLAANSGVDIGDVDVTSIIPGTGATNLGKALDSPVGSTDTGILALGVHKEESAKIEVADEDYAHLHIGELGGLLIEGESHRHFDEFDATTGWAALGNDTLNLATTKKHLTGTDALIFDKVDGAANTIFAGIEKTITTVNMGSLDLHDIIQTVCYLPTITNVAYVFIRIGTDSTNYNEWRIEDTDLIAATFTILGPTVGSANHTGITGNGWDPTAISYIAVGVAFDSQSNTLAGIIFDQLGYFSNTHSAASLESEVTSSVNTANINLQKIGGSVTDKGAGNASNGSQRIVVATDDVNLAAIKTATEVIDNIVVVDDQTLVAAPTGALLMGRRLDEVGSTAVTSNDGDVTTLRTNKFGQLKTTELADATSEIKYAIIDAASSGDNTIQAAAGAGVKIRVLSAFLVAAGTVNVRFESGAAGTALTGQMNLVANSGFTLPFNPGGWFETADNTLLNLELSAAISVDGCVTYVEV